MRSIPASLFLSLLLLSGLLQARPVALLTSPDGSRIFAALDEPPQLAVIDSASAKVVGRYELPAAPSGMALAADGEILFVTAGLAPGRLLKVETASGKVLADHRAGHSPCAPVPGADGRRVFVCNRFENEVLVLDAESGKVTGRFPVLREPKAAVLSKDGSALFVTNHLPAGRADTGNIAAAVSVIDVRSGESRAVMLPNGSTGVEGIALSPDGGAVYVTHTLARYGLPTTQVDRGWMNTSALSVIGTADFQLQATVLLDNIDRGAANPWGVACSPDGSLLFVAHAGTHEVSIIDRAAMHDRIARATKGERVTEVSDSAADIANDLSFLVGIRERRKLSGLGPRAVTTFNGRGCATAGFFSGTLHLVSTESRHGEIRDVTLTAVRLEDPVRRGELLFHDATRCFQSWQSCSTCHPGVRADALNWDLLNDGIGNPKQAKSMLRSMETPPAMISGIRRDAGVAIRAGMRHIQFAQVSEPDAKAIEVSYFRALKPVPSPALVDGVLSPAAQRGMAVFKQADCIHRHPGADFTDRRLHDVGTGKGREKGLQFDTPTLREVWRTAPYLHDGRAATLGDLFTREGNPGDRHGKTSRLSEQERNDLVEYVRSL